MNTQDGPRPARATGRGRSNGLVGIDQTADRKPGREPRVQEPPPVSAWPEPFRIFECTADGRRVIAPRGELDLSTVGELKERLAGTIDTVLDLSELSFIDSTGIHVVISTLERAQSESWEFTVRNPQPAVLRLIKLVGLDQHLGLESQNGSMFHREQDAKQPSPRG